MSLVQHPKRTGVQAVDTLGGTSCYVSCKWLPVSCATTTHNLPDRTGPCLAASRLVGNRNVNELCSAHSLLPARGTQLFLFWRECTTHSATSSCITANRADARGLHLQERVLAAVAVCAADAAELEAAGMPQLLAATPPQVWAPAARPAPEEAAAPEPEAEAASGPADGAAGPPAEGLAAQVPRKDPDLNPAVVEAGAEAAEEAAAQAAAAAQGAFSGALLAQRALAKAARRHLRALLQGARHAPPSAQITDPLSQHALFARAAGAQGGFLSAGVALQALAKATQYLCALLQGARRDPRLLEPTPAFCAEPLFFNAAPRLSLYMRKLPKCLSHAGPSSMATRARSAARRTPISRSCAHNPAPMLARPLGALTPEGPQHINTHRCGSQSGGLFSPALGGRCSGLCKRSVGGPASNAAEGNRTSAQ